MSIADWETIDRGPGVFNDSPFPRPRGGVRLFYPWSHWGQIALAGLSLFILILSLIQARSRIKKLKKQIESFESINLFLQSKKDEIHEKNVEMTEEVEEMTEQSFNEGSIASLDLNRVFLATDKIFQNLDDFDNIDEAVLQYIKK
eukprot:GHVL01027077.1.p1 GENE.GHVL01027077.1~~GHVL01027077.1.p1  ORF type:complete len:145 (+),score=35.66 GHVL01027077.1:171-605(+)